MSRTAYHREWRAANPEKYAAAQAARRLREAGRSDVAIKRKDQALRRKYGITHDEFLGLLTKQGGACAVCLQPPAAGRALHVDHNHKTKVVRGLLCHQCNWYLGKVDNIPGLLSRLKEYHDRG